MTVEVQIDTFSYLKYIIYNGRVVIDVYGEEKEQLTIGALIEMFYKEAGNDAIAPEMLLY